MKASGGYRPELDAVRGVAVLLVLLAHLRLPGFDNAGTVGVTLFFVLSGYLITGLLMAEHRGSGRVDLRAFYVRRARRLLPALIAVTGVVVGLGLASPEAAAAAFLYVGNWWYALGGDLGSLSHTWSLAIEEQFYIAWPIVVILLRGNARRLVIAAGIGVALVLAARYGLPIDDPRAPTRTLRFDAILLGCAMALTAVRVPSWGILGGLVLIVAAMVAGFRDSITLATLGSVLVVVTWRWAPRSLVRLGEISYGLYLWHFPVTLALPPLVAAPLSLLLALVSERWIERPFRRSHADVSVGDLRRDAGQVAGRPGLGPRQGQGELRAGAVDHVVGQV